MSGSGNGDGSSAREPTARAGYEKALGESEERYRSLVELAPVAIIVHRVWEIVYANPAAALLLGAEDPQALVGLSMEKFVHHDDTDRSRSRIDTVLRDRTHVPLATMKFVRMDGIAIDVETQANHLFIDQEPAVQTIFRDIGDRLRIDEALRESEQRFRQFFVESVSGFALHEIICDDKGQPRDYRFLEINPAFERLTGLRKEDVLGRTALEVIPGLEAHWIDTYGKVALTGEPVHFTQYAGELDKHYEVTAFCPRHGQFAVSFNDVTERKKAEAEFLKAKEQAEMANRAKSEFLASMSHDLRTPLTAILGFSEMMRIRAFGPLGDPHYEEYADDIHKGGSLLVSLIDDILDVSRIEAGKWEFVEEDLDMGSLIRSNVNLISGEAEASQLSLKVDVPSDLPLLRGDKRMSIEILDNLLSNALKFTPDGGRITVSAKVLGDGSMAISVADTGIGMSDDDIAKALEPFEQLDSAHARKHEGTGLGLYLCRKYVEIHGGTLTIESKVGKGTTVSGHFPPERTIRPS